MYDVRLQTKELAGSFAIISETFTWEPRLNSPSFDGYLADFPCLEAKEVA